MSNELNFNEIHRALTKHFNLDELRTLCAKLGVPYEEIGFPGTLTGSARELIYWLERRERLRELEPFISGVKIIYGDGGAVSPGTRPINVTPPAGADKARGAGAKSLEAGSGVTHSRPPQNPDTPRPKKRAHAGGRSPASRAEGKDAGPSQTAAEKSIKDGQRPGNLQNSSPTKSAWDKPTITGFLGLVLLVFFIWAFIYAPDQLPSFKQRILAVVSALLCGLFTFFLTGAIRVNGKGIRTPLGELSLEATGGIAVFVLVLLWWLTPLAPVPAVKESATENPPAPQESAPAYKEITATPLAPLSKRSWVNSIALDSAGDSAVIAEENGAVHVWKVGAAGREQEPPKTVGPAGARSVALGSDGGLIVVGGSDGKVRLWRGSDARALEQIQSHSALVYEVYLSRDRRRLVTTGVDRDKVKSTKLWSISDKPDLVESFATPNPNDEILTVSPDLQTVAIYSHYHRAIELWSITGGKFIVSLESSDLVVKGGGAFSEDGKLIAAGNVEGIVSLWRAADGKRVSEFKGPKQIVTRVALHPAGRIVAAGFEDGSIHLWGTGEAALSRSLKEHEQRVFSLTFSADGRILAAGGEDGKVQLWEVTFKA